MLGIMDQQWFQVILGAISIGVAGLITWAFKMFQAWLNTKIKNEKLKAAMNAITEVVEKAVLSIQQTFVEQLKKDGKFDKEKQAEALNMAFSLAVSLISDETKKVINENFGSLEDWLHTQIEAFILNLPGHSRDNNNNKKTING